MAHRLARAPGFSLLFLILFGDISLAEASQIRMKNGEVYSDATILRRDATSIQIQVRYGTMTLALAMVDRIDGVSVAPTPVPARPLASTPAAPPAASSTTLPVAESAKPAAPASPTPRAGVGNHPPPLPSPTPTGGWRDWADWQWHDVFTDGRWVNIMPFGRKGWLGLGAFAIFLIWAETLPRISQGLRQQPLARHFWMAVAFVLPALGYWLYLVSRRITEQITSSRTDNTVESDIFVFLDADSRPISIESGGAIASGIANAREILENALLKRASDVHIEPIAQEYHVRLRVDGTMLRDRSLPTTDGLRLVSALKILAQLDTAERRKAQDGRFGARRGSRAVDFRVATAPSMHGEMLVLRILDRKAGVRGLHALGMPQEMMDRFAQVVHSRSGMILATGPTGSGKSSTLYAALGQLDATQLKLLTIEDPVEYELAGATQIPVNPKAGVTYESGLRSILRLDPDVILVGEMRDLESAQIALRAALTGHLVFSSLHTRDAVGAVMRLEEMGIESHLVASALFVVLSQRLVRVLCDACREPYESAGSELLGIGIEIPAGQTLHRAVGCRKCEGTGYLGRTGIFEMLVLDPDIRQSVNNGIEEDNLQKLARQKGFASYREDGAMKVLLGVTTVEEVLQAN